MKVKIIVVLLLAAMGAAQGEIAFQLLWQVPDSLTDISVVDLNLDGYAEVLVGTGTSHEKVVDTPTGPAVAMVCEGLVSRFAPDGALIWEKNLCKNNSAADPCYSNGCISAIHASSICSTTTQLIFVGCCYCGTSSIIRVYDPEGELVTELYDDDGAGNPIPIPGCIRKILAADIDADNCKEIIATTNLELFIYDTDCETCTIPVLPTYRTRDLPVADRPSGTIYDFIVVNFDDDPLPTKEIVVAADELTVYEHDLTLKWQYEIDTSRPVRAVYSFDLDSDTAAHEIDQDPDLEPELIVGESWYIYVLDNIEYGNIDPTDDDPNLKWEYSTSPYDVNTVFAGTFDGPRNVMGGAATIVHIVDYNGTALKTFNAPSEVRKLDMGDFDRDGQNELVVFSNNYVSVFSPEGVVWTSSNIQSLFLKGVVFDMNLDGFPEIIAGYTLGLYVFGVKELEAQKGSEADELYETAKMLSEQGNFVEAVVHFEQARVKYEEAQETFMAIQCQKRIAECEKFLDTDRIVTTALEELRNHQYEEASYLFGEAAALYGKMGDKNRMSQMRVMEEAAEKLWQAHDSLMEAHELLLDEEYGEASLEATWARNTFEDLSGLFLTMSLDSLSETLKLEISAKMRECDEVIELCDQLVKATTLIEEADHSADDGDRFFRNQQYSQAKDSNELAENSYTEAAHMLDEIQIALGGQADSFRRGISDIEGRIETLQQDDVYKDTQTLYIIEHLKEKQSLYEDFIDEYEDLAESVGREAKDCRTKALQASNQAQQSYSIGDQFFDYASDILQPPASVAVGLACLIVVLVGLAAGKGRYVALGFLVLVLIFLGVSALQFTILG